VETTPTEQRTPTGRAPTIAGQRFVARQPIFDGYQHVFGYELLFRNGFEECFQADPEHAARTTLDSSLLFGLDVLCDRRRAFVNCTRNLLVHDLITLLPPDQTVVEVLEDVPPDDRVIAACRRLKKSGYTIALDDFAPSDPREPLSELADILKIDIRATNQEQRSAMLSKYGSGQCRMLAEKVETQREFREAQALGFTYFQGFFFRRPELMITRDVPANRVHYLRLLELVSRPELDLRELEKMVKQDVSVCYRFLRYLNSPLFGFVGKIRSVRHAIAMLGETELRRWIRLVVTLGAAEQKCSELVLAALARARFCELMSQRLRIESDLFLLGLLSIMDAILEISMDTLLQQLPLEREIKDTLSGKPSKFRPLYRLMLAQESGEWDESSSLGKQLRISDDDVALLWWQAMQWAQLVTGGL
jgi:c-di-GMP-related signal transduction protein